MQNLQKKKNLAPFSPLPTDRRLIIDLEGINFAPLVYQTLSHSPALKQASIQPPSIKTFHCLSTSALLGRVAPLTMGSGGKKGLQKDGAKVGAMGGGVWGGSRWGKWWKRCKGSDSRQGNDGKIKRESSVGRRNMALLLMVQDNDHHCVAIVATQEWMNITWMDEAMQSLFSAT